MHRWVREQKVRLGQKKPSAVVHNGSGARFLRSRGGLEHGLGPDGRGRPTGQAVLHEVPVFGQVLRARLSLGETRDLALNAHPRAIQWYGSVIPDRGHSDNLKTAVRRILREKARIEQDRFTAVTSPLHH